MNSSGPRSVAKVEALGPNGAAIFRCQLDTRETDGMLFYCHVVIKIGGGFLLIL